MEDLVTIFEKILFIRPGPAWACAWSMIRPTTSPSLRRTGVRQRQVELLVHRKGATRAFAAGHPDLPAAYRGVGQPVLIPGSMGTRSYVLRGTAGAQDLTFASSAHGAGRRLSRHQAIKLAAGINVEEQLKKEQVLVFSAFPAKA